MYSPTGARDLRRARKADGVAAAHDVAMRGWAFAGVLFIAAGAMHFVRPTLYEAIVPPVFGHAAVLVAISGAAEVAGGIGLLLPATRRAAGAGLLVLLIAVWPANILMAVDPGRFSAVAPAWVWWARVPLQLPLLWWVWRVSGLAGRRTPAPR